MKTCSKCGAVNKDSNSICAECDTYIIGGTVIDDSGYLEKSFEHARRKARNVNLVILCVVLGVFIAYNIWAMTLFDVRYGSLDLYVSKLAVYIPPLIVLLFPYNWAYQKIRRAVGKPEKYLSDLILMAVRAIGVIMLVCAYDIILRQLYLVEKALEVFQ